MHTHDIFKGFAPCRRPLMPIAVEVPAWGDLCPQICQKDRRYLLILFGEPHVVALGLFLPLLPLLGERSLVTSMACAWILEPYGKTERVLSGDGSAWKILFIFPGLFFWRVVGFIFHEFGIHVGSIVGSLWVKESRKTGSGEACKNSSKKWTWAAEKVMLLSAGRAYKRGGGHHKYKNPSNPSKHIMNTPLRASGHCGGYICTYMNKWIHNAYPTLVGVWTDRQFGNCLPMSLSLLVGVRALYLFYWFGCMYVTYSDPGSGSGT